MNTETRTNKTHSVAIVAMGGEFVVSCFRLGADGQADTDSGEVFMRTFQDAERAQFFFADSCKLLACNAARMAEEIGCVQSAISSLASCLNTEAQNEAEILARCVARLQVATLARKHGELEFRKTQMLGYASEALERSNARRMVGNISKRQGTLVANDR